MKRSHQGFTLLEVMAAIVIMALAFAVLLKAMGSSVSLTHQAAMRTQAVAWGQSLLDSAYAMTPPEPGSRNGQFNETYRWRLDVAPWQPQETGGARRAAPRAGQIQLYSLDLAVIWGKAPREHMVHLATLRAVRVPHAGVGTP